MADTSMVMTSYVLPAMRTILWLIVGLGSVIGFGYWLLVVQRRKKWFVNIWEQKADGHLQMVTKDILYEKRFNKGKQTVYLFKRQRAEGFPPPVEATYRVRGKEYCDYLRVREDFIPLSRELEEFNELPNSRKGIIEKIREKIIKSKGKTTKEIEKDFVYIPINQTMHANIKFKQMDYDINMMRINAIDTREKIYADKLDFLTKYGTYIAFGLIIVLIIVVLYLSYDYSTNVIQSAMNQAQQTTSMVEQLAQKMGGSVPAN